MKAVRLVEIGEPVKLQEVPLPVMGPQDVLVRIKAAGICRSDVHYRAGTSPVGALPRTLGHEVAGIVEETGHQVTNVRIGDRVCLHYLLTCKQCQYCRSGNEHLCIQGRMIGKHIDGGYAEYIASPACNAIALGDVPFEQGAILMCSSSTSFHALRKARLQAGETVAVFGAGGLGMSAIQLANAMGAAQVYAIDINDGKLNLAQSYGAIPIDAIRSDPVAEIRLLTGGRGVDVAVEVIGLKTAMEQAVRSVAALGRAVLVGITDRPFEIDSYRDLLPGEAEVIGSAHHLLWESQVLVRFLQQGRLDLSKVVTRSIPLDAGAINRAMDALEQFGGEVRTVITP